MKTLRIFIPLFASVVAASAVTETSINQQLDVAPGGNLVVDVDFGTIDVTTGADDKVAVDANRKLETNDEAKEKEYTAAVPIDVTKEGNTITVRARGVESSRSFDWGWHHAKMDARYSVHVPKNFNADLKTRGGEVSASGITGQVKADTSGGDLKFKDLHGPLNGKTSGGSVKLEGCVGELKIATSGGGIDSLGGSGHLDARTSGGSVAVRNFGGDAKVETSGGGLRLANVNGKLSGRTSGGSINALLASPVSGDVKLETSAGSIEVILPASASMDVKATGDSVNVLNGLSFLGQSTGHDSLVGKINGGGKQLDLRTSAGNITLKLAGPETAQR